MDMEVDPGPDEGRPVVPAISEFENAEKLRKNIKDCVEALIITRNIEEIECLLNGLLKSTDNCPRAFAIPLTKGDVKRKELIKSDVAASKAFTKCLLCYILNFLNRNLPIQTRVACINFFGALFERIKAADYLFFIELIDDYVQMMEDLIKIYDLFINKRRKRTTVTYKWFIPDFTLVRKESPTLKHIPFAFDDLDQCELLRFGLAEIMSKLNFFSHIKSETYLRFVKTLCVYLETGNGSLYQVTFTALARLLTAKGVPDDFSIQEYFFDCLRVFFLRSLNGKLITYNNPLSIEDCFSSCLDTIFNKEQWTMHSYINMITVFKFIDELLKMIVKYGVTRVTSNNLKRSMCEIMVYVVSHVGNSELNETIKEKYVNRCASAMLHFVGNFDYKWTVHTFCVVLPFELELNAQKSRSESESESEESERTSGSLEFFLGSEDSGEDDSLVTIVGAETISPTWKNLQIKLDSIIENLGDNNFQRLETVLNELQTIVAIAAACTVSIKFTVCREELSWLSSEKPSVLMNDICFRLLCSKPSDKVYSAVVNVVAALICAQDKFNLRDVWPHITAFVALPWVNFLRKCEDVAMQYVVKLSNSCGNLEFNDTETLRTCLWSLAVMPTNVAPTLKLLIFRGIIFGSNRGLQELCVEMYSYFMQLTSHERRADLIRILELKTNYFSVGSHLALANSMGPITCMMTNKTCLVRKKFDTFYEHGFLKSIRIKCNICQPGIGAPSNVIIDKSNLGIFINLLSNTDREVKLALIRNMKAVFRHVDVDEKLFVAFMDLMDDDDKIVRITFSREFPNCVGNYYKEESIQAAIVERFRSAFTIAVDNRDFNKMETLLEMLGRLAWVVDGELMEKIIIILVTNLLSTEVIRTAMCHIQLMNIAKFKNKGDTLKLFYRFSGPICQAVCDIINKSDKVSDAVLILKKISKALEFKDERNFVLFTMRYLLPYAMMTPNRAFLLKLFSDQTQTNRSTLVIDHFTKIYAYLVCFCPRENMGDILKFLERESGKTIGELVRQNFQASLNEMLLYISTHYNQVYAGLVVLASHANTPVTVNNKEELANFLQVYLLGFLAHVDVMFMISSTPQEDIEVLLQSLSGIIKLMGEYEITRVRMKFLATLRSALTFKDPEIVDLALTAWDTFVQYVSESALGPLLSLIVVPLLPLLETKPKEIAKIFNYCIVDKKESVKQYLSDLYLIPEIPELVEVNEILKEYGVKAKEDFLKVLRLSLKTADHENLDVRINALIKLRDVLRIYKDSIYESIMVNESLDPVILQLVKIMLEGCRETNKVARSLIGECLGELGAIDPGRLGTNKFGVDMAKSCITDDEEFAFELIQELSQAYLRADGPKIQDCSSYAMQKLLKIYKPTDEDTKFPTLWAKLPDTVKDILTPLFASHYKENTIKLTYPRVIYTSVRDLTFNEWVCSWCGSLVNKIKQESAVEVFTACRLIIKYDVNTALFMLPHALLKVLLYSTEDDRKDVLDEVLAVLSNDGWPKPDEMDLIRMSIQTVFSVLDFLKVWIRKITAAQKRNQNLNFKVVQNFLDKIPYNIMEAAAYDCQAYPRALMNCELYIKSSNQTARTQLAALKKVYIALYEQDSLAGLATICIDDLKLSDQLSIYESSGQYQEALACYERIIIQEPQEIKHYQGILKTFFDLGQPNTALNYANGTIASKSNWTDELNRFRVEAAWKLSDWSGLESFLTNEDNISTPGVAVGQILLSAKQREKEKFEQSLSDFRVSLMGPLSAAGMENYAYQRGYEYLIGLHMLNEVEKGIRIFLNFPSSASPELVKVGLDENPLSLIKQWDSRLKFTQSSLRGMAPILSLRRVVFGMAKIEHAELSEILDQQIGYTWLQSAKVARKSGNMQLAHSCLLEASNYNLKEVFFETAKWHWNKSEEEQAILSLKKGLQDYYSDKSIAMSAENKLSYAKAKLLLARYSDESGSVESKAILDMYKEVQTIYNEWEDALFYLAQYLDKMCGNTKDGKSGSWETITKIVRDYSKALQFGSHFTYQSMSRMLSVWLELGQIMTDKQGETIGSDGLLTNVNKMMADEVLSYVPLYKFLIAFPQLVSWICHPHKGVFGALKKIIAALLVKYSQQTMWQIIAVLKSSVQLRAKRCAEIINFAECSCRNLKRFSSDLQQLVDKFLQLSNFGTGDRTINIPKQCPGIQTVLNNKNRSKIMLPLQSAMTVNLSTGNEKDHNPYPNEVVYIEGIENTVEIMPSLQKPKKIYLRGSDGKRYPMMCKPRDDLRKDCRLMEFNALVNKSLQRDPEARRRQLHIRTYTVVPLNEACGLIEWVDNLRTIRNIIYKLYKDKNMLVNLGKLKVPQQNASLETRLNYFRKVLLPLHPSVLSEWFLENFLDPTTWYLNRLSYSRTLAVMSMVGYILGLGDRHGENILLDNNSGNVVHVDFNCLFNRGTEFLVPERVPFRLTRNLIDAMGVTGYEGVFRKTCEVTLRVMRKQKDTLGSVLKTFVNDPLVEWKKPAADAKKSTTDVMNQTANSLISDIEHRIRGVMTNKYHIPVGLPLSVEGHANHLILEATSEVNLCQMYFGWAAYM